jgi:FtsP/CotA-like multicopper oxidase with cupredoxin domain
MTDVAEAPSASSEEALCQAAPLAPPGPTFGLRKFADPLRIPPMVRPQSQGGLADLTIRMRRTQVRLHSQLPPTTVWAYNGQFPGPTLEVRRRQRLRISWTNDIDGPFPLVAVQEPVVNGRPTNANEPGYNHATAEIIEGVAELPAWTVVHLHGARTGGGNDGWPHNAVLKGDSQLAEYPNDQQATALWYHDHAMNITRWNVLTGLAGMYLIRDDEEDALHLPCGKYEVPLMIADRNLDTDDAGNLTGQLLYKVVFFPPPPPPASQEPAPLAFTGPFTLVNGVIWPHLDVEARWYRFRVLNAANTRLYRLDLIDEQGRSQRDAIRQIGTDGGLLPKPIPLPSAGLDLTPSERADLLIDFSRFRGKRLRLTNLDTSPAAAPERDIIEFRVSDRNVHDPFVLPKKLSTSYFRVEHGTTLPEDHDHEWVAFVPPGILGDGHPQMWELQEIKESEIPALGPNDTVAEGIIQIEVKNPDTGEVETKTFKRVANDFDDTTTFFIDHGRWAIWNFLHIAGPTPVAYHPAHVHLTQFQALSRERYDTSSFDVAKGGTVLKPTPKPMKLVRSVPLNEDEKGWKDTIRVDGPPPGPLPTILQGDLVKVAGEFGGATGNFVYHCHILDHEDEGMMRPFVVMPAEVMHFGHVASGGHGHGES